MEILNKKLFRTTWVLVLIFGLFFQVHAQNDNEKIQAAFTKSYELENGGDYTNASKALKEVYDENSYEINIRLGWLSYQSGFFTESAAYYEKAIVLKPLSIEARLGYAYPASAMGNWNFVINKYEEILEIDPSNSLVLYRMGSIYYGKENYANAIKYYEKAANFYPFDYDITIMYAWTNYQLGKLREARVLFQKALMITPGDKSALEGLGLIQ